MQLKLAFTIPLADIIILGIIALLAYKGFRRGVLSELLSIISIYFSFVITAIFYERMALLLQSIIDMPSWVAQMSCFAAVFFAVWLLTWVVRVLLKAVLRKRLSKSSQTMGTMGTMGKLSKIGGVIIGILNGVLIISIFFMYIDFYPEHTRILSLFESSFSYKVIGQVAPSIKEFTVRNIFRMESPSSDIQEALNYTKSISVIFLDNYQ